MRRLLAWFRAHRIVTWSLRVIVALWGIHLWMNWAAEREWQQYWEEARRRGVKLTLAEFAPPEIPDAENFAMLPMFHGAPHGETLEEAFGIQYLKGAPLCGRTLDTFQVPNPPAGPALTEDPIKGRSIDWTQWQQAFKRVGLIGETSNDPIADVLRGFDGYAPQIREWREWKQRPRCRFPFDGYASFANPVPTDSLSSATRAFGWRMRAHLAQNNPAAALDDFRDGFQSYRALRDEPTAMAGLTRTWLLSSLAMRIGGGLATHAWGGPELQALETELSGVNLVEDYRLALSSERARSMDRFNAWMKGDTWQRARICADVRLAGNDGSPAVEWLDRGIALILPGHWVRKNQLRRSRWFDEQLARLSEDGRKIDLDLATPSDTGKEFNYLEAWHYLAFYQAEHVYRPIEKTYVSAQTNLHQLRLAIVLERFHLAHGAFPKTLDSLVPEFLPEVLQDPWSGKAMKYRRDQSDSYVLYSVGEDRKDDGGVLDPNRSGYQHDTVWRYAPQ